MAEIKQSLIICLITVFLGTQIGMINTNERHLIFVKIRTVFENKLKWNHIIIIIRSSRLIKYSWCNSLSNKVTTELN